MSSFSFLLTFVLACSVYGVLAEKAEIPEEDGVLVLSKDNFKQALEDHFMVLVEFYAPWCGHCKALEPEWVEAAKMLKKDSQGFDIRLAKVDATIERELAEMHQIEGFPTLKLFKSKVVRDCDAQREAKSIYEWLLKKALPATTTLSSVEEAEEFVKKNEELVVLGFFADLESDEAKAFRSVADVLEGMAFGVSTVEDVAKLHGVETLNNDVILLKNFDEKKNVYTGEYNSTDFNDLLKFLGVYSLPLVVPFNQENARKLFGGPANVTNHVLYMSSSEDESTAEHMKVWETIAKEFRGQVLIVHIDTGVEENLRILEYFGVSATDGLPAVRAIGLTGQGQPAKFQPDEATISEENMRKFAQDFIDGKLEPVLKSEEEPEDWNESPVKVLVGKKFNERVIESEQSVFVEFYAPWCGHCKQLIPTWEKLAKHFADNDKVMIAKLDSTANELTTVEVQGFPTLIYFKAGQKDKPIKYAGKRDFESLKAFVEADGEQSDFAEEEQAPEGLEPEEDDLPSGEEEEEDEADHDHDEL